MAVAPSRPSAQLTHLGEVVPQSEVVWAQVTGHQEFRDVREQRLATDRRRLKWLPVWIGGGAAALSGAWLLEMILLEGDSASSGGGADIGLGILALLFIYASGLTVVYLLLLVVVADIMRFFHRHDRSS